MPSFGFVGYRASANVGDAVQTYALMTAVDADAAQIVDRDDLTSFRPTDGSVLLVNGWLTQRPQGLCVGDDVDVRFVSVHLAMDRGAYGGLPSAADLTAAGAGPLLRLFARSGPIGCRDLATLGLLREVGVDAYFSGCATLLLQPRSAVRRDRILAIDIDPATVADLRRRLDWPIDATSNYRNGSWMTAAGIQAAAEDYLDQIAASRLVVTSRLHAALPAVAMGVPVVFAPPNQDDPRFAGLLDFLPVVVSPGLVTSLPTSLFEGELPAPARRPAEAGDLMEPFLSSLGQGHRVAPSPVSGAAAEIGWAAETVRRRAAVDQRDAALRERDLAVEERDAAGKALDAVVSSRSWRVTSVLRRSG